MLILEVNDFDIKGLSEIRRVEGKADERTRTAKSSLRKLR